jgi:hypothetical protein
LVGYSSSADEYANEPPTGDASRLISSNAAVEAEVTEFLGRDRDQSDQQARSGYRRGHAELHVTGPWELS